MSINIHPANVFLYFDNHVCYSKAKRLRSPRAARWIRYISSQTRRSRIQVLLFQVSFSTDAARVTIFQRTFKIDVYCHYGELFGFGYKFLGAFQKKKVMDKVGHIIEISSELEKINSFVISLKMFMQQQNVKKLTVQLAPTGMTLKKRCLILRQITMFVEVSLLNFLWNLRKYFLPCLVNRKK